MREKAWWLALALGAAGCAAKGPFAGSLVKTADLPVVGTVGDFPPASNRVLIELSPGHPMLVDGKPTSVGALGHALMQRIARRQAGEGELSDIDILIRADRRVSWGFIYSALGRCVTREGTVRAFFAVRSEGDGKEGAIALFLPRDRTRAGVHAPNEPDPYGIHTVEVALANKPDAVRDLTSLYARLHSLPSEVRQHTLLALTAASTAPVGEVLRVCDLACRAGVRSITFFGESPSMAFASHVKVEPVQAAAAAHPALGLVFSAPLAALKCSPVSPPIPRRVSDGYAGITEIIDFRYIPKPCLESPGQSAGDK